MVHIGRFENDEHLGAYSHKVIHWAVLSSGITLIVAPNDHVPMVSVDIIYEFDPSEIPDGVPHLTEHLLFESTKHLENGEVDRLLRLAGGRSTASTTWDRIVISDTIASSNLNTLLHIEAERSQHLCEGITIEELENQRAVIAQELLSMTVRTNGDLADRLRRRSFAVHPVISKEVMGQIYDLESATKEDICLFAQHWLQPHHATWVISGAVDVETLTTALNRLFPTHSETLQDVAIVDVQNEGHRWFEQSAEDRLTVVFAAPPAGSVAEGVSDAMLYSLTQPVSLSFFTRVDTIQTWSENRRYGGWMAVSFNTDSPEQTLREFQAWVETPRVDWAQWNYRQRHLTAKYQITNEGRVLLLKACNFALDHSSWSKCFDWHLNRFEVVPSQTDWAGAKHFWNVSESSILWQGSDNVFGGDVW